MKKIDLKQSLELRMRGISWQKKKEQSHVEIRGIEARFYDFFLIAGTLGYYQKLITTVISDLSIKPDDSILDLGAGTGKNACIMLRYLSEHGSITGLEIGKEMRRQFQKKCSGYPNVSCLNMRIEESLPFENEFDKVFISFVIHGFEQNQREKIINNAYKALKEGGRFFIFDWNEFDLQKTGLILKSFFHYLECPLAQDFIKRDFKKILEEHGFKNIQEKLYASKKIRLLSGQK